MSRFGTELIQSMAEVANHAEGRVALRTHAVSARKQRARKKNGDMRQPLPTSKQRAQYTIRRSAFAKISAIEGIHLTEEMEQDLAQFDRLKL